MGFFPSDTWSNKVTLAAPACGICKLEKRCQRPKVQPRGRGKKNILIVSESPSGKHTDDSSDVLARSLSRVGIDLYDDCLLTYSIICDSEEEPTDKQLEWCRPNLQKVINEYQPNAIIPIGGSAIKSLLTPIWRDDIGYAVERWAGFVIPCQEPNCWIMPTYHPSYLLKMASPILQRFFDNHIAQVASCWQEKPWNRLPDYKRRVRVLLNDTDAETAIRKFIDLDEPTAIDLETNMLKPDVHNSRIVCCALSDGKDTIAYPWTPKTKACTDDVLRSRTPLIASNMKFEQGWFIRHLGHPGKNWHRDTMLQAHWEDCRSSISGLKFQAFVKLGQLPYNSHIEPYFESESSNLPNRIHKCNLSDLLVYCGMDALLERLLV